MKKLIFNRTLIPTETFFEEENDFLSTLPDRYETSNPMILDIAWDNGYEIFLLDENKTEINIRDLSVKELRPAHRISKLYMGNHFTGFINNEGFSKFTRVFEEYGRKNSKEDFVCNLIKSTFGNKYPYADLSNYEEVMSNADYLHKIVSYCISELKDIQFKLNQSISENIEYEKNLKKLEQKIENYYEK